MTPERSAQWSRRLQGFRRAYEKACRDANWPKARKAQALRQHTHDRWAADVWSKRKPTADISGRDYGDETREHPVEDAFDVGPLAGPWGRVSAS